MFHYFKTLGFTACYYGVVFYIHITVKLAVAELTEDLIPVLYLKYQDALKDGERDVSVRRLFSNNKQYEIHVKRLKEVNGFKAHNLMVKEHKRSNENPLIYINNPVESKLPHAYLTLEEFKNALTKRIQEQKDEIEEKRKRVLVKHNTTKVQMFKKRPTQNTLRVKTTHNLFQTDISKVMKSNNIITERSNNEQTEEFKLNTITKTEFKPIARTKHDFTAQNNNIVNDTTIVNVKDIAIRLETISLLIERDGTSPKTIEFSKQYTETDKIENNVVDKFTTQTVKDISKSFRIKLEPNVSSTPNFMNITEANEETKDLDDTETFLTNTKYEDINNTLTTPINLITTAISHETTFSPTTDTASVITKEMKRETPRRSTVTKKPVGKKELSKKSTKWRRSTLGRPMVFME